MKKDLIKRIEEKFKIKVDGQLNKILMFCEDMPVLFDNEKRLLSIDEILDYETELKIESKVIPLIDCYDNDFLVYNIEKKCFEMFNISTEESWQTLQNIDSYINSLDEFNKRKK